MNWVNIVSGNGLSSVRRQVITWTNAGLLSIGTLRTHFSERWIQFKKMRQKISSAKLCLFCPGGYESRYVNLLLANMISVQVSTLFGLCAFPNKLIGSTAYLVEAFIMGLPVPTHVRSHSARKPRQESICVCAQPMGDDSLIGWRIHKLTLA